MPSNPNARSYTLPAEVIQGLADQAKKEDRPKARIVAQALREYFERNKK